MQVFVKTFRPRFSLDVRATEIVARGGEAGPTGTSATTVCRVDASGVGGDIGGESRGTSISGRDRRGDDVGGDVGPA